MNRLAQEHSPYLRQHQDNPVDWYPWGEEALARARQEDRPILLSVGYSACHWCHVMAHESFEDPDTARRMNDWYVNIKVDREERPDLDQLYQGVVQLMGRGGGWPLTVFLTPDLLPFFGGTYFPPASRYGLPGFPVLLERLHEAWTTQRPEVLGQAEQFREGLQHVATYGLDAPASAVQAKDILDAAAALAREVDRKHGGFGGAPKFPNPMNVALLLRGYRRSNDEDLLSAVLLTLERMANGGIYDQLGGGFHRYSVDEKWLVPHFEKMLYDNAQLLHLYAEAHQLRPNPLWEKVARETVAYLEREMTAPEGGLYAAQDADSEGEEGKYFVWTPDEVQAVLTPEEAEVALAYFGITPEGNFEHGTTILEVRRTPGEVARELGRAETPVRALIDSARGKLFLHRERRVKPGRDDKVLTGWNGLALRGLAFASRVFDEPEWALHAARAADFLLATMWDGTSLRRSFQEGARRIDGMLEDYGDLAAGLVALFQATFSAKYLEAADAIARRAVELFWDEGREAWFAAPRGQQDLVIAPYAQHDNAYPSGASTLTEAQIALAALTGKTAHLEHAERYLSRMREPMRRNPFAFGHLLLAADAFADGAAEVTVVGARANTRGFLDVLNRTYAPTYALLVHDPAGAPAPIVSAVVSDRPLVDGGATAYLCRSFTCERPLTNPEALAERLSHP